MQAKRSVIAAALAILVLSGCSQTPQAKAAKYLEKGKKEFAKKKYDIAVLHFKNAVVAQPLNAEPYYQLGLAYLALKDYGSAIASLRRATERDPKHTAAQVKLAGLMATSSAKEILEDAATRMRNVLTLLPDDIGALNVLAVAELRLGQPEKAEAHLVQALRKQPDHLDSSVLLAQIKVAQKDVAGAEKVLLAAAAAAPKSPDPRIFLGGFYRAQGKTAEAEQQLRQALAINPKNGGALLALGELQLAMGQADRAEQTYRQVSDLPDKQFKPVHALYLFRSGKRDQAVAELEKLHAADPTDRSLRNELVTAYLTMNRTADANRVLTAALKKNGLDTDALLQRARIYLTAEKYPEAQTDLNQVLHFQKNSPEAHYLLAQVARAREDPAMQKQELGEALRSDPNHISARLDLAQVLLANRSADSALKLLDDAPKEQKNTAGLVLQRNWALLQLGQKAEARKGIDRVLAAGKVPEALLQDAALKLSDKDYEGARVAAESALSQNPDDSRALEVLVQSYAARKQIAAGLQKAREHALRRPAAAAVQQFCGQLLAANGDRAGARKFLEAAQAAKPGAISTQLALAELDRAEGKREDARKRLQAAISSHPRSVAGRLFLANLEFIDGKAAAAMEQYRKAVELDDRNAVALNGLAYLLAESSKPDEALKYAQKAKEVAPDSPAVDDTLGWTYFQKGMHSMAITHLESAVAKEGSALRKYHLAMAYLKAGDPKRGNQVLQAALRMDPNLPEARTARQMFGIGPK